MRDWLLQASLLPIRHIQEQICRKYGLTMEQMLGAQRSRKIAWPRHEAMYLASKTTCASLPVIGRAFGDRDHTTVMHAIKRHEERMKAGA